MNASAYVTDASNMAGKLVERELRGPGDLKNAMRRVEQKFGVPYKSLWSLRYRPPKEIAAHVYANIVAAYDEQCARQARFLEHERAITKAKGGLAASLIRAADAVVGEEN